MIPDGDPADFVLFPVDGPAGYGRRGPGESPNQAIRCHVGIVNLFGLTSGGDHSVRG